MMMNGIQEFLASYFDVLQTQDLSLFDQVFHKDCVLYAQQDGKTIVRPLPEYRRMVEGRESPQSRGFPRQDEILMIDLLSPEMALVKVRLQLFDSIMADYLNLMKIDGQWRIVAKHFHRVGDAAA
ncbi:nuclear transport factor 2 family protein [Pseudoxanthomonas sp. CF125]|uniref:nuclear transport factor 2 family protein n=1 Tax=Pseudoxanthomonas sp. CF125 TaxID=1855303 RepID=UPI0008823E2F|nr:nuclear transport factor 2 family protein [Pseudoxanthomonas sp. CF125]SDR07451.1 Putative lumazine-binding [Pseudoxanthomonas sp. CF125]